MVDLLQVVVDEAAKAAATSAVGAVSTAGRNVVSLLRERLGTGKSGKDTLSSRALAVARADKEWADRLIEAVSELHAENASTATAGIENFRNHFAILADPPRTGLKLIVGPGGSGKTELARQIADRVQEDFPSGRVEVPLARYRDGDEFDAAAVKRYVLEEFGIPRGEIPVDDEQLDRQFLSVLVTRSFVLILDDVRLAAEPALFTRFRTSLVLATASVYSRELKACDPTAIELSGLDVEGARQLLVDFCGKVRPLDEPVEADQLIGLCDRMPLALREVGVTLAGRAGETRPVATLLDEYRATGVVDAEGAIQDSMRRTFARLSDAAAEACALLAEHPGGFFTRATAAAMTGDPKVLDELIAAQLTVQSGDWYSLRILVGHYARKLPADRDAAFDRLLAYVRDTAVAADFRENPRRLRTYVVPPKRTWELPVDHIDWLEWHRSLIGELVKLACLRRRYKETLQLAGAFEALVNKRWYWREFVEISDWAVKAVEADEDAKPGQLPRALMMRGKARYLARWFPAALEDLDRAAEILAGPAVGIADRRWRTLRASLAEFRGRFHEERADLLVHRQAGKAEIERELSEAARRLRLACALSMELEDGPALAIHPRMLANVLIKLGEPAEAIAVLGTMTAEGRNQARIEMVYANAYLALGELPEARARFGSAWNQLVSQRATQYAWELRELQARLMTAERDPGAIEVWGSLAYDATQLGHPRADRYFTALESSPAGRRP
ncbi:tetratricopeptide repeat protein [Amycolatopsis sp. WAC 01375]|uniref:tetratricopeptide repeat protein n=1 Tax=Amycolatopsis sp. WAC 01375 TaxID=2203194 RepID=UPI000F78C83C|nr:tetratricopeptide repeat protein [Amycolatopsis sp. WAC 01375]